MTANIVEATRRCKHPGGLVSCSECRNYDTGAKHINMICIECVHAFPMSKICHYTPSRRANAKAEGMR